MSKSKDKTENKQKNERWIITKLKEIYEDINEQYEIMVINFDSNILFPLRVMYKRNKNNCIELVKIFILALIILMIFIWLYKLND